LHELDQTFLYILGASLLGGVAHILIGEPLKPVSKFKRGAILVVVALPMGVFAGSFVEPTALSREYESLKYIVAYFAATKSHTIMLQIMSLDFKKILFKIMGK